MQRVDPTQYRHFLVEGVLRIHGTDVGLFQPGHADDLPLGADGKLALAERVRKHAATQEGDPAAAWQQIEVQEFDPPSARYQVPKGTL